MADVNASKRVAGQNVVKQPPVYLPEGHPDIALLDPKDVIIVYNGTVPSIKYLTIANPFEPADPAPGSGDVPGDPGDTQKPDMDKFDLTSIEGEPTLIKKYDPVTNALTYWAVFKIRNTSISPENVKGVDARVYIPGS